MQEQRLVSSSDRHDRFDRTDRPTMALFRSPRVESSKLRVKDVITSYLLVTDVDKSSSFCMSDMLLSAVVAL